VLPSEDVSLDVGMERHAGVLAIRRGEVVFDAARSTWILGQSPIVVERHMLAPLGVRWKLVLGHDEHTGEPITLVTTRRRARRFGGALKQAGFSVTSRRVWTPLGT
jgi:hypothetical protein